MTPLSTPVVNHIIDLLTFHLFSYGGASVTLLSLILAAAFCFVFYKLTRRMNHWFIRHVLAKQQFKKAIKREALIIFRCLVSFAGALTILKLSGLDIWIYEQLIRFQRELSSVVDLKLFTLGKTPITLWTSVYLLILSWLLVRVTGQMEELFITRILTRTKIDRGMIEGMGTALRYSMVSIGMLILLQSAGIDLSALTIMAGAAGIAIGLGMQTLLTNLVSGLVILFERPIKIGDRIEIAGTTGDVTHVSLRATTILTNDGIAMIVPNSEFITSKVINWTYTGRKCGLEFPIKVAGGTNPKLVKQLLLQVVSEHPGILRTPAPAVLFEEFSSDGLKFTVSIWTSDYLAQPARLRSDLNFAIAEKCKDHGIELPGLPVPAVPAGSSSAREPGQSFQPPPPAQTVDRAAADHLTRP